MVVELLNLIINDYLHAIPLELTYNLLLKGCVHVEKCLLLPLQFGLQDIDFSYPVKHSLLLRRQISIHSLPTK